MTTENLDKKIPFKKAHGQEESNKDKEAHVSRHCFVSIIRLLEDSVPEA